MFRLLGSPRLLWDGLTCHDFLPIDGLGTLGLGISDALRLQ
jgi:hypothetical protein